MSWKDYLYFQKSDRIAIILLLVLIVAGTGVYIATRPVGHIEAEREKTEFEKNLMLFILAGRLIV